MQVKIELRGTSPLLMHNIRLADPDDEWTQEISKITSKRKKTEDDRRQIERLEWFGGLYTAEGAGIVVPTSNIRKCFIEAAKITRQGKQLGRAVAFTDFHAPLVYNGNGNLDALYANPDFSSRLTVGIGTKRVIRVRPRFYPWTLTAEAHILTEVLDLDDLKNIVRLSGISEGLGDNRSNGYGRFEGKVTA